jgi:hypothetical protein
MKIGLLIPSTSKGRNEWKTYKDTYLFKSTLKSFLLTYDQEHEYVFYIGIDRHDRIYDSDLEKGNILRFVNIMKNTSMQFIYMDNITKGHLTVMWNRLYQVAYDDKCDYFFQCGDDIEFHTKSWINDCINILQKHENFGLTGPVNNNARILTQSFVSRRHMELFGYYFPEDIINWFCDDWYNDIYKKLGHFYPLRNHYCANIGGAPRYNVNNEIITSQLQLQRKSAQLNIECKKIVNRDYLRVKDKLIKASKQKPSSFCTICTSVCSFELVGLLLSLSVYHPNELIYILCDSKTKETIQNMTPQPKLLIKWFVELDIYDGMNRQIMEQKGIWSSFQMSKARVMKIALKESKDTLFLDSDIVITHTIDDINRTKNIGVSPQYIKKHYLDKTGKYNGGMLWTNHKEIPDDWIHFTESSRYFDQASIEDLVKKYDYFEFGENYNLQCWRMLLSDESQDKIAKHITSSSKEGLKYKNKPLKFIHTHFLDKRFHSFNTLILHHLKNTRNFKILSIIYRVIHKKWIIHIPKQPIHGLGHHKNDSFREIPFLIQEFNKDVEVREKDNTVHCWIEPNILCYDRPTLQWINQEVTNSSLLLLGNGNVEKEGVKLKNTIPQLNIKPWIFWPRKPKLVEELLDTEGILSYQERSIDSIFIGNFENNVQERYRNTKVSWESVLQEHHCTKGSTHKFTHNEYLMKLRKSKFGLCLRGYGSKCHREVELMAFGTVPLVTPEVSVKSYMEPLIENIHYIYVKNPEELKTKLADTNEEKWNLMSKACFEWYRRNVHSKQCWNNMIEHILY